VRAFLNAILAFIGATALTDEEFDSIELDEADYTVDAYAELLTILQAREAVSTTRDRLAHYFLARGVEVTEDHATADESSSIFVGGVLCE
jgi:hypothetical protein